MPSVTIHRLWLTDERHYYLFSDITDERRIERIYEK